MFAIEKPKDIEKIRADIYKYSTCMWLNVADWKQRNIRQMSPTVAAKKYSTASTPGSKILPHKIFC